MHEVAPANGFHYPPRIGKRITILVGRPIHFDPDVGSHAGGDVYGGSAVGRWPVAPGGETEARLRRITDRIQCCLDELRTQMDSLHPL